jgi:hypothetical protein
MADDLVKRLEEEAECYRGTTQACLLEAKALIEELKAALDDVATHLPRAEWHYLKDETLITIGEKKDEAS